MADYIPNNTKWLYLQGKAKWAKLVTPDTKFNCWSVVLYPTEASLKLFNELKEGKEGIEGIKNVLKKDDDGYYFTLKRPTSKVFKGTVQGLAPPEVLEADGQNVLRNAMVGNGSDITCKIEYYKYNTPAKSKGTAIRLLAVRVDNLVPYEMSKDFTEGQKKSVKGLVDQPGQTEPLF